MARGITLTDLSEEKTERIRENLDFDLPQNAKMYSVYANSQQDSTFRMIFEIPRETGRFFWLQSLKNMKESCLIPATVMRIVRLP